MEEHIQPQVSGVATIRKDVIETLGENWEPILRGAIFHTYNALSTVLVMHERFNCFPCMTNRLTSDFFPWLNEEGYCYILNDFSYPIFIREAVQWATDWAKEQMLSPCTDGMETSKIH